MKFESVNRKYNQLNDFIRGEMKRQKISQDMLAYRLNLPRASISKRLNGISEWTAREIIDVYEFLGIEMSWNEEKKKLGCRKTELQKKDV